MLLRCEAVIALGPEMMVLDVGALVLPIGHLVKRQVGNLRESLVELLGELLFRRFERWNLGLEPRDLGHQRLRRRFPVAALGRADLLRRRVATRQRSFRLLDGGAPALVEGN